MVSFLLFTLSYIKVASGFDVQLVSVVVSPDVHIGGVDNGRHCNCKADIVIGLFTVAILGPFSSHFQTHFRLIFVYLAEEQTKRD